MKNKNIDLEIIVKDFIDKTRLIYKNFSLFIKEDFLFKNKDKAHNLENHIENFKEKIKTNQQDENSRRFQKYDIHYVSFWVNIWNEINWIRPSLIYKSNRHNWGFDLIVIPMTWLLDENWKEKDLDKFDVVISKNKSNRLKKQSILKVRHIKSLSKKRIWNQIWKLENILIDEENEIYLYDEIDNKVKQMIWLK